MVFLRNVLKDTTYKNFLQIKVYKERLNFLLA